MKYVKIFLMFLVGLVAGICIPAPWEWDQPAPAETPEEILGLLNDVGLEYEGRQIMEGSWHGFHLKPRGDKRTWENLAAVEMPAKSPRHVILVRLFPSSTPGANAVTIGKYLIIGDPQEIARLTDGLAHR